MTDEYGQQRYKIRPSGKQVVALHQQYFNRAGIYQGEDTAFHSRWREIGGTVWAHPEAVVGHCSRESLTKVFYPKW
jgi:hypothetical protein